MVWLVCCIVAVMLIISCDCGKKKSYPIQAKSERGIITDRNGIVLVTNDSVMLSDSAGTVIARSYPHPIAAQLIGHLGEAAQIDIDDDEDYSLGDIIGKTGVEKYYDKILRGERGVPGKNLKLTIDYELQKFGEELMEGLDGSIVAIEPSAGEVLCMVSSPTYNPRLLSGDSTSSNLLSLQQDSLKPFYNRSVMGLYPPGGVFKAAQGLVFLQEDIISAQTRYPCERGFENDELNIRCHGHSSPLTLAEALGTDCNGYFSHGHLDMMDNGKYEMVQKALEKWRDYIVSLGFGYKLGIDLPNEKRGLIPNASFYDKACKGQWSGSTIINNALGQGEVLATPLQLANLSATIANRGYYRIPHVVKEIQGGTIDSKYAVVKYTKVSRNAYEAIINGMQLSATRGTCRALSKLPIESCGVSGTATLKGNDHSVFIGFAPIHNPRIAVAVYVVNGVREAKYAAPIGGLVMEKFLKK